MDSTFGTKLRLQREEQQIPLAAIAEQTKIKLSLLEGLERDDVSRWPTGIFRRSYFRAYASGCCANSRLFIRIPIPRTRLRMCWFRHGRSVRGARQRDFDVSSIRP